MSEERPVLSSEPGDKRTLPASSVTQPPNVGTVQTPRLQTSNPKFLTQGDAPLQAPPPDIPRLQPPPQQTPRAQLPVQANPSPYSQPFLLLFTLASAWAGVEGLDCFKCGSVNGSDPQCSDPFHHNYSTAYLASPCLAGWKGREGVFPASHCVKLSGYFYQTGETMFVRGCTTDSGTLTVDTELGRQSHCGVFLYDDRLVVGCVEACNEFDGCNASSHLSASPYLLLFLLVLLLLLLFVHLLSVRVGDGADL
ncbi:uncharacterized protein LOC123513237 [Portunus trituberculatus]|uniref:uncharacterized protein LOC123513237 n=1 Tax=Portunus trituberculatus TaxID=210409 RepID=UPI001E1D111C|nr:uncharacterized protein LOC123513237 [Portunus trituberculatus]